MCFNFEVSIGTFLFSWIISIYLLNKELNNEQKNNIILLMIFSSIQLADAILWYNGMKKNNINYITTSFIIPFILSLQILFNVYIRNNNKNPFITLFVISSILYIFIGFNGYSTPLCNNKLSSPVWGSKEIMIYELVVFSILILFPINNQTKDRIIILIAGIIAIMIGGAYGSLWCAIANIIAFYYLYKY
tara:strand:+ start:15 stop:584 length:570 start_codon:yes stop_codon:yes gene_type:complete